MVAAIRMARERALAAMAVADKPAEVARLVRAVERLVRCEAWLRGLDPAARKAVWEKILSFKKEIGTTVFFNTHYMDEADLYSDGIAIMSRRKRTISGVQARARRSISEWTSAMDSSSGAGGSGAEGF